MMRAAVCILLAGPWLLGGCGSGEETCDVSQTVTISGIAFEFGNNSEAVPGATVSTAECPEIQATSDDDGFYELVVPDNATITPVVERWGFKTQHFETLTTAGQPYQDFKLQMVPEAFYNLFAGILDVEPDPANCQVATTVNVAAIRNTTLAEHAGYGHHGVAGATVSTSPTINPANGPVYFNDQTIPTYGLTETSIDGGVVWHNVPPGVYTVTTAHPELDIRTFVFTCEPGRFINAGPPWGPHER